MAIKTRNKRSLEFSTASMSDLVFLLLIFFIITSTLVSPNAIKLLLPNSTSKTMAKQTFEVYIDADLQFHIKSKIGDLVPIDETDIEAAIAKYADGENQATIVLRSDATVPIQNVVGVIDAVNNINQIKQTQHKIILATRPAN